MVNRDFSDNFWENLLISFFGGENCFNEIIFGMILLGDWGKFYWNICDIKLGVFFGLGYAGVSGFSINF
jgi:hypothetical protein